jgi:hypothetical protein
VWRDSIVQGEAMYTFSSSSSDAFAIVRKQTILSLHRRKWARGFLKLLRPVLILLCTLLALATLLLAEKSSPALTAPAPGATLSGSSITFSWSAGAGATEYRLFLGTTGEGSKNLFASGEMTGLSVAVSSLPEGGATIYARLEWLIDGKWHHADYTYTEASSAPSLSSLTCSNSSMLGAGNDACTVTLSAAAASGGFKVSLASNNSAATVPSSVTVASGATTAIFSATVSAVTTAQAVTLTATAGSVSETFSLQLEAYVPTLSINATSIAFGDVTLNTPATQSLTLTSTGTAPVTVSSATISGTGYSVSGATFPLTLSAEQTVTLSVEFDPTAAGADSGTLTISSNSSTNSTATISLSGTGGSSETYEVDLSWDAPSSSSDPVAGYNIYRSPSGSSSYTLMGKVSSSELAYTDGSNIQDGQTYDYIVESVDASGNESVPSNMANVTIP